MPGKSIHSLGGRVQHCACLCRVYLLAGLALLLLLGHGSALAQLPPPVPQRPDFEERPFGPTPVPTPTPTPKIPREPSKPIPRGWIIGGTIAAALAAAALVYGAIRAWRASNLFDRQYRLPIGPSAAVRLGGSKCGGLMATVSFASAPKTAPAKTSEPKDA